MWLTTLLLLLLNLLKEGGAFSLSSSRVIPAPRNGVSRRASIDQLLSPSPAPAVVNPRPVRSSERSARLPVWPAWNGLAFVVLDLLGQNNLATHLEDLLGGRVSPMMLDAREADPFILLVHHRHSFQKFDPLRAAFRFLMAEGFPAHPHRGFETVTYVLPGKRGLVHRDSLGFKMRYSDGDAQWMTAGRGILHEEMWETDENEDAKGGKKPSGVRNLGLTSDAELYQLWLNLPPSAKMTSPRIQLVRPAPKHDRVEAEAAAGAAGGAAADGEAAEKESARLAVVGLQRARPSPGVIVRVLSGEAHGVRSETKTFSPVTIIHATLGEEGAGSTPSSSRWELPLPSTYNCLVYVRRGSVDVVALSSRRRLKTHELAYLERRDGVFDGLVLEAHGGDVMVFAGEPLRAPVASSGTMVMNTDEEVDRAFKDYQRGEFGIPWDHSISDEEWRGAVASGRSRSSSSISR